VDDRVAACVPAAMTIWSNRFPSVELLARIEALGRRSDTVGQGDPSCASATSRST